jgi:hypothetical protein
MSASALNPASLAPIGAKAPGQPAAPGSPLAGFEALLTALFPQVDPTAAPPPSTPAVSAAGAPVFVEGVVDGAVKDEVLAIEPLVTTEAAADPNLALLTSLAAGLPQAAQAPVAATPAEGAPPAWGKDKAKGSPAAPALLNANPHARLFEKADVAPDGAEGALDSLPNPDLQPTELAKPAVSAGPTPRPLPPAAATAPQTPPPPTPATVEAEVALELPAGSTPAPQTEAAPADQATAAAAAALASRQAPAPPPAQTPAARATRTEKAKAASEAAPLGDAKTASAVAGPVQAKTAVGDAASVEVEASAAEGGDPKGSDAPDALPTAEAQFAAQGAAPAAPAPHGVRGSPETVANLAAQIIKKLEGQSTRFDLELDPHGLGKVDVRIEIGAHGRMTAAMMFDNPQAAADMKARSAELLRALDQAGFDLAGGLSFDVAQDRGQARQGQDNGHDNGRGFRGQAFQAALDTAGDAVDAAVQGALRLRRGVSAGLDLRI